MGNFALLILDSTEKNEAISREQYWIDKLEPIYDTLKQAGNTTRYKHTPASREY